MRRQVIGSYTMEQLEAIGALRGCFAARSHKVNGQREIRTHETGAGKATNYGILKHMHCIDVLGARLRHPPSQPVKGGTQQTCLLLYKTHVQNKIICCTKKTADTTINSSNQKPATAQLLHRHWNHFRATTVVTHPHQNHHPLPLKTLPHLKNKKPTTHSRHRHKPRQVRLQLL